jgi:tRNA modification GTPase
VSTRTSEGVEALTARLGAIAAAGGVAQPALVTRIRQVRALEDCAGSLGRAGSGVAPEIIAEELRAATESLGRLMGRVDVEEVLGQIFAEFCIGK